MTMQRWDPFGEMLSLRQAMDRLMEDAYIWPGRATSGGTQSSFGMPIDLSEQNDELILKASLPGVRPEDVQLSVQGNLLTIQGEARDEHETPRAEEHSQARTKEGNGQKMHQASAPAYHHRERRFGRFFRQIVLPA